MYVVYQEHHKFLEEKESGSHCKLQEMSLRAYAEKSDLFSCV